ncbi:MAG: DEAD/DEAH box helicase [Treponema sp.]|jgi:ATP-dependent RNA helicase DeaD|nr:DEAD/DEAH box helicase [Treponema sp.]
MIADTSSFSSFGLSGPVLGALSLKGFTDPTPIQTIALPRLLAESGHLIVKARTGTGKTAAFGIPLVERISRQGHAPQALILTPTRELALQVSRELASLTPAAGSSAIAQGPDGNIRFWPRITAVYGGASIRTQILDLKRGTEIVVGTPGRVMDLMDRKVLDLSGVDWFILDEADEMLDMGFFEDVETIMAGLRGDRRVALFSATMPEAILKVVRTHIGEVDILEDAAPEDEKPAVDQYYMILKREDRLEALRRIVDSADGFYGLIFCATKAGTDELNRRLVESGYPAEAIHGDLSQEARERTLRRFRSKQTTILVATDVAARGLDIERLTHVINWDLPGDRESYVHRIGRTGRAGRRGKAISLALPAERGKITQLSRSMERILGSGILWMKVPSVKSVMKAVRARIVASVLEVLPGEHSLAAAEAEAAEIPASSDSVSAVSGLEGPVPEGPAPEEVPAGPLPIGLVSVPGEEDSEEAPASPFLAKVCRQLIERVGAEKAVEALISVSYGELLDPSRYGTVMEFAEESFRDEGRRGALRGRYATGHRFGGGRAEHGPSAKAERRPGRVFRAPQGKAGREELAGGGRVYVGLGRRHGASARDVAALLGRAGNVPGRLVDAIEMKDYCAFATLPEDAARRACAFSRRTPDSPPIRLASDPRD